MGATGNRYGMKSGWKQRADVPSAENLPRRSTTSRPSWVGAETSQQILSPSATSIIRRRGAETVPSVSKLRQKPNLILESWVRGNVHAQFGERGCENRLGQPSTASRP